jgi:predicted regulator of Ras-like GTPase activity (Roadblock/LC7/MglB family)
MQKEQQLTGVQALNQILAQLNQGGGFDVSVLTDNHGLCLASAATPGMDPDVQSAVVAQVQKTARQVGKQLGMGLTDEIALNDQNGQRLICRPFNINDHDLILAVILNGRSRSHRRVTNQAISEIRQVWQSFWE